MITSYRFETVEDGYQIVETRDVEEVIVYKNKTEKRVKDIYRKMKRGQCGFNGWTPKFLLT
jgi:predicted ATP-dependent protease